MRNVKIAPSVLSLDFSRFEEQCQKLNESQAEFLHFDVMDGHFVPNLTFGTDILKGFKKAVPNLMMDVHLMVENPGMFIEPFVQAGADMITFHYEACENEKQVDELLQKIHSYGIQGGVVIKPKTDVRVLLPFIDHCDMVLVMSVEPGFGGQSFMADMLDKVVYLRNKIDEMQSKCLIEIDGGINENTARLAKKAGVDVLVAGSYVFKGEIVQRIESLCED